MLLVDADYFRLESHKILLANLLSAASLVIARGWKLQEAPVIEDWVSKFQETWLLSKLSAMCKYRAEDAGALKKFHSQWTALTDSGYVSNIQNIKEILLTVI